MRNKRTLYLSLVIGLVLTFSVSGIVQNFAGSEIVVKSATVKKTGKKKSKKLFKKFLNSEKWRKVKPFGDTFEVRTVKVTSKKIFDFDNDGNQEMWFRASASKKASSRESVSGFCTIINGKVKMLLHGYMSDGSIGGTEIVIKYDKKKDCHVVGESTICGGFMGSLWSGTYYEYNRHETQKIMRLYTVSQVKDNYTKEELNEKYYVEKYNPYENAYGKCITIYEKNDKRITRKKFNKLKNRFVEPTRKKYIVK